MMPTQIQTAPAILPDTSFQKVRRKLQIRSGRIGFYAVCLALAVLGFFTKNGIVTSAAFLFLPVIVSLTWRRGEPPVLVFACLFQWLQATAAIFYTNHLGASLDQVFGSNELAIATWLSLIAVLVLAIGIRCAYLGAGPSREKELKAEAERLEISKIALLYPISVVVAVVFTGLAWRLPSITQPLLAVAAVKWAVIFLLCYTVVQQRRGYGLLVACVGLEFVMGLFGIFSNFKDVFFVLVVAVMSSTLIKGRRLVLVAACFVFLFIIGVVWSSVKMDYRSFVADETSGPEDTVPIERKFTKLADLVEGVTWDNFTDGIDALVMRVSYVNFFAIAIENVPNRIPYENGELWKESVIHILTPRVFFPNKPTLDDSERTRTYTGIQVAGIESGTSIGIGYVGESYIDFGPFFMFVPIFLLGVLYGLINRFFITRTKYKLLGASLAVSCLIFNAYAIETSNIKLLGGLVGVTAVAIVFYKVLGPSLMVNLRRPPLPNRRSQSSVVVPVA